MSPSNRNDSAGAPGASDSGGDAGTADIVVLGAKGRMGQMVLQACAQKLNAQKLNAQKSRPSGPRLRVVGAVESPHSAHLGQAVGIDGIDVPLTGDLQSLLRPGVIVIDFTSPQSSLAALETVRKSGAAHVICTTGFSPGEKRVIEEASASVPIVLSPNMSVGVTLMFKVAEMVARTLGEDFDVEIIEAHHNLKKDSPSGTALGFAEAVARGHGVELSDKANYGREGMVGARPRGEIGIHAVRGGDIVGDHTVLYAGDGERIELKHMAHSRMTFAQGAVKAALFLAGKPAGMYDMVDVLGL